MAEQTETQEEQAPLVDETSRVKDWRFAELRRAGWSDDLAQVVAACLDIDLHVACELVEKKGCRPSLAALVLL